MKILNDKEFNYIKVCEEPMDLEVDSIKDIFMRGAKAQYQKDIKDILKSLGKVYDETGEDMKLALAYVMSNLEQLVEE